MNVGQQAQDQATVAAQQKTSTPMGGATSSPTADVGQYRQASLGTMGGQQGAAAMAANAGAGGTQQRSNMFSVPTTTGLTFGGA
jgi:predicted NUDIX family NTP pyrophosphohydrolase